MYPASFEFAAPTSLAAVLAELHEHGDEAKVLAGGQSLIPLMKLRFAAPGRIVDVNAVDELAHVTELKTVLRIGALTRHAYLEHSDVLARNYPAMSTAAPLISDPLVRNMGTIGGSLAHADPAGDWGSVMLAMNAEVVAQSTTGKRTIPITDFFKGMFTTALDPTELLTEIRIPRSKGRVGGTYLKLERKVGDFATVGVAVQLELGNGRISRAGIGLTAVGPQNLKATAAEQLLEGQEPSPELFEEAAAAAESIAEPHTDVRGSAQYKRAVVRTYVARGLTQALSRARSA